MRPKNKQFDASVDNAADAKKCMFYKSDTAAEVQKMMCVREHQLAPLDLRNAQNSLLTLNGEYLLDL
jgi:hypothetical protein